MTSPITGMIINGYIGQGNIRPAQPGQGGFFRRLDSNGDSGIDKTEFSDLAARISETTGNTPNVDDVYSKYDADGNGSLSREELEPFLIDNPPPLPAQRLNAVSAYGANRIESMQNDTGGSGLDMTA